MAGTAAPASTVWYRVDQQPAWKDMEAISYPVKRQNTQLDLSPALFSLFIHAHAHVVLCLFRFSKNRVVAKGPRHGWHHCEEGSGNDDQGKHQVHPCDARNLIVLCVIHTTDSSVLRVDSCV